MSTLTTTRVENSAGDGVDVAGLGKIEDTGKNICTAWVVFDGTTTPPTIIDSYNVSSVDRTTTGVYSINFTTAMDNTSYTYGSSGRTPSDKGNETASIGRRFNDAKTVSNIILYTGVTTNTLAYNIPEVGISFFGGKA